MSKSVIIGLAALCALLVGAAGATAKTRAASSLPRELSSRPGPDLLYQPPPRAPQFDNVGVWKAPPTLVCLSSAYRRGEYLYQDCLWDDHGGGTYKTWFINSLLREYTYPKDSRYRQNAADLVELRLKPLARSLAIRLTYNTMTDPDLAATTIALGESAAPREVPHGANTVMPAQVFLTAHGNEGDLIDAGTGKTLAVTPTVRSDATRRQVDIRVPYAAFDPRGNRNVRIGAATGLWDQKAGRYLTPKQGDPTATRPGGAPHPDASAFFNVAFRFHEPMEAPWRDKQQLSAVQRGDISGFSANVDFVKLAQKVNDNSTVPAIGYMNRIYASRFELAQGRRIPTDPNGPRLGSGTQQNGLDSADPNDRRRPSLAFGWPCRDGCVPDLAGNLQRYTVYVPKTAAPAAGYGMFAWLPGYAVTPNDQVQGPDDLYHAVGENKDAPAIVVGVDGRGADTWWYGEGGATIFEAWADIARRYRLDPLRTAIGGFSSGAYGANKLALQFPDAFGRAFICDGLGRAPSFPGLNGLADTLPVDTVTVHELGSDIKPLLPSRLAQHVMEWAGVNDDFIPYNITRERADAYGAGDYAFQFVSWSGPAAEHGVMCNNGAWQVMLPWLGDMRRNPDPLRVVYVRNPRMDDPRTGLVGDHAYWLSDIQTRSDTPDFRGTIDVRSDGFGVGVPPWTPPQRQLGSVPTNGDFVGNPKTRLRLGINPFIREWRNVPDASAIAPGDALHIAAKNIARVTVDPKRARVDCNASLDVKTDGPLTVILLGCASRRFG